MELYQRKQLLDVIETLSSNYLQGKVRAIRLALVSLLSGGHLLIEDIPGLGKTSLALTCFPPILLDCRFLTGRRTSFILLRGRSLIIWSW